MRLLPVLPRRTRLQLTHSEQFASGTSTPRTTSLRGRDPPSAAADGRRMPLRRLTRMAQGSAAPPDDPAAASRGISRRTQSEIYRAGISGTRPRVPVDADALEAAARKALSAEAYAYIAGGAGAERTVAANRAAFERWQVWPRPLRDVSSRDLSIDFLGARRPTPLLLAPLGVMEMAHPDADLAVARAAASLGVPYTLSNQASVPMEEVRDAAPAGSRLFQLYWSASDELNASLLRRAEASGCEAIVVTLDTHLLGWRTRDLDLAYLPFTRAMGIAQYTSDPVFQQLVRERSRASAARRAGGRMPQPSPRRRSGSPRRRWPPGVSIARKGARAHRLDEHARQPALAAAARRGRDVPRRVLDARAHLGRPRQGPASGRRLPIILKGIVHPDDAIRALDAGIDGIWISNHGGRQIDQSVPTLEVLPDLAERVAGRVPIVFDSGVRQGSDAFIALALGATAVALGRPYAYGLGIAGEAGVREVVRNVLAELDITLGLSGHTSIAELDRRRAAPGVSARPRRRASCRRGTYSVPMVPRLPRPSAPSAPSMPTPSGRRAARATAAGAVLLVAALALAGCTGGGARRRRPRRRRLRRRRLHAASSWPPRPRRSTCSTRSPTPSRSRRSTSSSTSAPPCTRSTSRRATRRGSSPRAATGPTRTRAAGRRCGRRHRRSGPTGSRPRHPPSLVGEPESFTHTPVVFGVPETMAKALGWPGTEIGIADFEALCSGPARAGPASASRCGARSRSRRPTRTPRRRGSRRS